MHVTPNSVSIPIIRRCTPSSLLVEATDSGEAGLSRALLSGYLSGITGDPIRFGTGWAPVSACRIGTQRQV
ncbi:Uncharacterised protein [Mycobacteroides abscessus subsp. abscessus]|nr:Uncharacterised protein [Mycobacteroides abscessus subsp. abscessus]